MFKLHQRLYHAINLGLRDRVRQSTNTIELRICPWEWIRVLRLGNGYNLKMKVVAAYLLAVLGGNTTPTADDLRNILGSEMLEEVKVREISRGDEAITEVRAEDDKLTKQVDTLKTVIYDGTRVAVRDINFLLEMLERQLLTLDNIKAEGEGKLQRKMEVSIEC